MTRVTVRVDPAVPDREHCWLPARVREAADVGVGDQVRLWHGETPALYTVHDGDRPRVSPGGRDRLGADAPEVAARVDPQVVRPDLDYEAARETGEFVEGVRSGDETLVALAPHGGHVEPGTDAQARRLADRGATAWYCAGWWPGGGAFDRWHVTSNDTSLVSFPGLAAVADRTFDRAVSFHGWTHEGVGVGGGAARAVRERVRDAVADAVDAPAFLVTGSEYRGDDPANVVNRLAAEGVQLEQSLDVRQTAWEAVADAVADALG
ncbi:MAG: poly-gamma-glutamate hydrolase family protein [Haloarculaceae archaeon]